MIIKFFKAHGVGNDYIFIDRFSRHSQETLPDNIPDLARKMSKRHTSVGSDGLVLILPGNNSDVSMRMFNADGSEGMMCGNAIRCVSAYAYRNGYCKPKITVNTASGIYETEILSSSERHSTVRVDMNNADFSYSGGEFVFENRRFFATYVNVGNPHAVIFLEKTDLLENLDIVSAAKKLKRADIFPEEPNVEFVKVGVSSLDMRVCERGSGETYACGTGACASVAAAVRMGLIYAGWDVPVRLIGGTLDIRCDENYRLSMTGPAEIIFYGEYEYEDSSEL